MELIQRYHPQFAYTDKDASFPSSVQEGKKASETSQLSGDISCLPTFKEATDAPSTRWDAIMSRLVMWLLVNKRKKNLATTNSQTYSRPSEIAEQRKREARSGSGQRHMDAKSPTTSIDIEPMSPRHTNHSLKHQMPSSANDPVIELVSIEKPAAIAIINSKEPMDTQIDFIYERRTSNSSSSTTGDSESIGELVPAAHVSSFLRQPERRATNYSPKNSIEGTLTRSASPPTSPKSRILEISDAVHDL